MSTFWKDIYTPLTEYETPLKPMEEEISIEEWRQTVSELSLKLAAGPSGILYRIIKKLPEEFVKRILCFINICYKYKIVPSAWKSSNIVPISKPRIPLTS